MTSSNMGTVEKCRVGRGRREEEVDTYSRDGRGGRNKKKRFKNGL